MSEINSVSYIVSQQNDLTLNQDLETHKLTEINSIFVTRKTEENRATFEETFDTVSKDDKKAKYAVRFLEGLISNKKDLHDDLKLSEEQYDALSCVALALASQETGMGLEEGYIGENTIGYDMRFKLKLIDKTFFNGGSASSGLTQIKIDDFMNSREDLETIFKKYGIKSSGVVSNNLFAEPDKAAIATMIVLSDIVKNYDYYINALSSRHEALKEKLDPESTEEECTQKGFQIMDSIISSYEQLNSSQQDKLRTTFKQWLLSYNGSLDNLQYRFQHPDDIFCEYNEEVQLKKMNKMLKPYGVELNQDDLNYIRYALSSEGQEMNAVEYAAYGWHTGVGPTLIQLDRMLAEKIGTIFSNPEDFDYDQYSANVESLTDKYAQQIDLDKDTINYILTLQNQD